MKAAINALQAPVQRQRAIVLQRCGETCPPDTCDHDEQRLNRTARDVGPSTAPPLVHEVLAASGSQLDAGLRTDMERQLGHDFGAIRIHADSRAAESAAAVGSLAYTVGNHVVLGSAPWAGESGHRILAHELVHTIQQSGRPPGAGPLRVSQPSDPAEQEAERLARVAMSRTSGTDERLPSVASGPAVQRACGWAEVGSVAGCAERSGNVSAIGQSSEDVFFFVRDCDDFLAGESDRLAGYAARIRPDDEVDVDGFASEEGLAEFNMDLACARAKKAAELLSTAGAYPRSLRLYSHGATPGDRPTHRSAVVTVAPAPDSPFTTESKFHPGVMHDHKPSGRWADVQSNPKSGFKESLACENLSPASVIGAAIQFEFGDKRNALEHLNWYLWSGGGADYDEDANLEVLLRTEPVVQARVRAHVRGRSSGKIEFNFPFQQSDYVSQDLRFAFGAIDRMDFEIDLAAGTVHAWFMDRYEWHPVYPFYSHFADDVARPTNCVHAAMVEMKSSGASDYWMIGEATVPLSVFGKSPR